MIKLAICQIKTELDYAFTMRKAEAMLRSAKAEGADFAVLPEMFACPYSSRYFKQFAAKGHVETVDRLSSLAAELGIYIVGGSVPETDGGRIYNSCFIFDRAGKQIARHRKLHLFDCELSELRVHESHIFSAGNEVTVFDTEYGRMGCAICFDVRFPELFRAMAARGARLVFLPAQFNIVTGSIVWPNFLSVRAVDQQIFMVGASAARNRDFNYQCLGRSMVTDPYGATVCQCDEAEQILYADIELEDTEKAALSFPLERSMRHDIYTVTE